MKSNGRKHGGSGRDSIALDALLQHIGAHPEVLRPIDAGLVERLYALIEGVEVDLNQRLPTELGDPGMP
jgi:hypothetical protein